MRVIKAWPTCPHLEQLRRATPVAKLPVGSPEDFHCEYMWLDIISFPSCFFHSLTGVDCESILSKPASCKPPLNTGNNRERDLGNPPYKARFHLLPVDMSFPCSEILQPFRIPFLRCRYISTLKFLPMFCLPY